MKKLFIPALVLFGSLSAQARYHEEIFRVAVTSSACTIVDSLTSGQSCTRTGLGNSTANFGEAFTTTPFCFSGSETMGAAMSFVPGLASLAVSTGLIGTGVGTDAKYAIHCIGF